MGVEEGLCLLASDNEGDQIKVCSMRKVIRKAYNLLTLDLRYLLLKLNFRIGVSCLHAWLNKQ